MIEAIQHLPDPQDVYPLRNEDTRLWLRGHGFDLSRWLAFEDKQGDGGTWQRHFRQDEIAAKPLETWR